MIKKALLALLAAAPLAHLPANAETVYLIIKSRGSGRANATALLSIPMKSMETCEEEGARIISSKRFDMDYLHEEAFECVRGK